MRRRLLAWCGASVVLLPLTVTHAQTGNPVEGALEFVLPTGARSLGMGQAVIASAQGSEALWWNPALIARGPREAALGIVSGVVLPEADVSLSVVYPVPRVIAVGLTVRYLDYGQQAAGVDNVQTGSFSTSTRIVAATFAAPFGDRLAVGLSFKLLAVAFNTTGQIPNAPQSLPLTGAIDVGGQYILTRDSLLVVGAAVRNVGFPLQINDAPQADPLPGRLEVGVEVSPRLSRAYPGVSAHIAADVVTRLSGAGGPGLRFGGELSWLNLYHARVGYVVHGANGASGPTVGVGASLARWRLDFAQFLSDLGTDAGSRPTYLTLRFVF